MVEIAVRTVEGREIIVIDIADMDSEHGLDYCFRLGVDSLNLDNNVRLPLGAANLIAAAVAEALK